MITLEQLKAIMPGAKLVNIQKYLNALNKAMDIFEINTPLRKAAFLSQIAVESGQLKYDTELSSGIHYEGRKDLGNTQPGDGARFKGRGILQLTGRTNYMNMTKKLKILGYDIDLITNPELAVRPDISAIIAGQYFKDKNLNALADQRNILAISRIVNGGYNGIKERISFYNRALKILG